MNKEEIIEKTKKVKHPIDEMEAQKINKANWIAVIVTGAM